MATASENSSKEETNIILTTFYDEDIVAPRPVKATKTKDTKPVKSTRSTRSATKSTKSTKPSETPEASKSSDGRFPHFKMPKNMKAHPIVDILRNTEMDVTLRIKDLPAEVPKDKETAKSEAIQVVKKDNMFGTEVTESEMEIIQQRVLRQQQQFAEYEHKEKIRKFKKVYSIFDYLTIEEMEEMILDCKNNEDEVCVRMTEPMYLLDIRKTIASKSTPVVKPTPSRTTMSGNQLQAYQKLLSKRSATLKKTTDDTAKKQYRLGGRLALDDAIRQVQEQGVDASTAFEGWSAARIRAYNLIDQNPNSYYYRFNAPGEVQRKGQWAADERKLFFARLDDVGANGQWGHFAMTIPGRVGYQCSNFYRLLVENGEVNDPNYVLDEKGKAHYLFDKKNANGTVEKTFRTHNKHGRTGESSGSTTTTTTRRKRAATTASSNKAAATTKRKRRARRWGSDDDDDDDDDDEDNSMFADWQDTSGSYTSSSARGTRASTRRTRARTAVNNDMDEENDTNISAVATGKAPASEQDELDEEEYYEAEEERQVLPGFIDPITLDEVEKPAISKYGHVMGYDSWVRCLTNWEGKKNICPLTKNPLSKRDLVILTFENIEEYRSKIMNM